MFDRFTIWLTKYWEYTWKDAMHDVQVKENWKNSPEPPNENWKLLLKNRCMK